MDFAHGGKVRELQGRINAFMDKHIYPAEAAYEAELQRSRKAANSHRRLSGISS
jgi:acyl-CoA dehydrogenase